MDLQPTKNPSSQIKRLGYDATSGNLQIRFKTGATYEYDGVTPEEFDALASADSHGKAFGSLIRGKKEYRRLPEEKPTEQEDEAAAE